jgi:hypothetical protein
VPKSSRGLSFGRSTGRSARGGNVTLIEMPVRRSYKRRAMITFWVTATIVGLLAATVASHYLHPIVGALLGAVIGVFCGAVTGAFVFVWPVLRIFWYWLPEILLGLGLVYGWTALMETANLAVSLLVVVLVAGVPAAVAPVRRRVQAVAWCLIVRHRLRMCFASFIASNWDGTLPLILLARPTPAGERVWVWLRPGLSVADLEQDGQLKRLAVACWANEVRVVRSSRRNAALIRVDITRREPLAGRVLSPLPEIVPDSFPANAPVSPATPPMPPTGGLDLADVPEEPDGTDNDRDNREPRGRKPRNPTPAPSSAPTFASDNADYA